MVLIITALVPCLSLIALAICGTIIATRKGLGQIKVFKLSKDGLEIWFDKDKSRPRK